MPQTNLARKLCFLKTKDFLQFLPVSFERLPSLLPPCVHFSGPIYPAPLVRSCSSDGRLYIFEINTCCSCGASNRAKKRIIFSNVINPNRHLSSSKKPCTFSTSLLIFNFSIFFAFKQFRPSFTQAGMKMARAQVRMGRRVRACSLMLRDGVGVRCWSSGSRSGRG